MMSCFIAASYILKSMSEIVILRQLTEPSPLPDPDAAPLHVSHAMPHHIGVTTPRETLLEKLVVSLHLNVPERRMLGSDSVSVEEVAALVKRLLEANGVFPLNAKPWQPGEIVFEGFFLLKGPNGKVRLAWQRSNPIKPSELAEQGSLEYDNADEAVSQFIQSEWSEGIDGINLSRR
jgi:hypothetical protein